MELAASVDAALALRHEARPLGTALARGRVFPPEGDRSQTHPRLFPVHRFWIIMRTRTGQQSLGGEDTDQSPISLR